VAGFGNNANEFIEYSVDVLSNLYSEESAGDIDTLGNDQNFSNTNAKVKKRAGDQARL